MLVLPTIPVPKDARRATLGVLKQYLTEENTDLLVKTLRKRIKRRLPRWARWLPIGKVLDALLPEVLLDFFEDLLR